MQIETSNVGDVLVVLPLENRIDAAVAIEFKSQMIDFIRSGSRRIVLDLSRVEFIDSSGLGAIVSSRKTIGDDGDLVICGILETVGSLFRLTKMHRVFGIYPSKEEALKAFSE